MVSTTDKLNVTNSIDVEVTNIIWIDNAGLTESIADAKLTSSDEIIECEGFKRRIQVRSATANGGLV